MSDSEEDSFKYLSSVTVKQAWGEAKFWLMVWLLVSTIVILINLASDATNVISEIWNIFPGQVWFVIGFTLFTWMLRGEEEVIRIYFPKKFILWLFLNLFIALMAMSSLIFPSWVTTSIFIGWFCLMGALANLEKIGKANLENQSFTSSNSKMNYEQQDLKTLEQALNEIESGK